MHTRARSARNRRRQAQVVLGLIAMAAAFTLVVGNANADTLGSGFTIDGTIDVGTEQFSDPYGSVQELGPINENTTKLEVIHSDALPTLEWTDPNGQADFRNVWLDTNVDANGDTWLYFAFERDSSTGSSVLMYEFQKSGPPADCDFSDPSIDQVLPASAAETYLIQNCNPWANRQVGDFLIVWDQQGQKIEIVKRTFGAGYNLDNGVVLDNTVSAAAYSADGFYGEAVINLSKTVFPPTPTSCLTIGNVIPMTVTGNSDTADVKDTVLAPIADKISISNCGSVKITKVTDPAGGTGSFPYTLARAGGSDVDFDNTNGLTRTDTLTSDGDFEIEADLKAGTDYTLSEGAVGPDWALRSIVCDGVDVTGGGTFSVVVGETTECTITNESLLGRIKLVKTVVNDNSPSTPGSLEADDFPAFLDATQVDWGEWYTYHAGDELTASETEQYGYAASDWTGDCAADGSVTIAARQDKICYITNDDEPFAFDLIATKTATTTYTRTHTWDVEKSVDPETQSGLVGESLDWTWDVDVSETPVESAFAVSGSITVTNPTPFEVEFSVADSVGGTAASVTCPTNTLAPSDSEAGGPDEVTCTYDASLSSKTDGTNTATITSLTQGIGGTSATAPYTFGAPSTVVGGTATVTDTDTGLNESLTAGDGPWTFTAPGSHTCSTDPSSYADGSYTGGASNTATVTASGGQSDSDGASTSYTCYAPVVTKDATATYDETHTWDITKSVAPESQSGVVGDTLGWTWTVNVSESSANSNFAVTGTIDVYNPSPDESMTVDVADVLDDGTNATVDCGSGSTSLTVAAGETGSCSYSASPTDASATLNTATATIGGGSFTGTADVDFDANVIGGTATVTDTKIGLNESLTAGGGPWTYTGPGSHTCSSDRAEYGEDWTYGDTLSNTATVTASGGQSDSDDAETEYTCTAGFVDIIKTTNGSIDPTKDIRFKLWKGTTDLNDEVSTLGDADGQLQFQTALIPGQEYTICESPVPAGYTFEITVQGSGGTPITTFAGPPGVANPTGEVQCFKFIAVDETTLVFEVNNSYPGGAPRTPGYWKNWNDCTSGNQADTAAALGGPAAGVYILEDLLPRTVGTLLVDTCQEGVYVLDARWAKGNQAGKQASSDAAYSLARAYLAAELNLHGAGACVPTQTFTVAGYSSPMTFEQVLLAAQSLLVEVGYDGDGELLTPKAIKNIPTKQAQAKKAQALMGILDTYNNEGYCTGTPSH
jgi:hypothetical protein